MPSAKEKEAEEMKKIFLDESEENLSNLEKFIKNVEKNHSDSLSLMEIYRILHNFKGVSGTMGIIEFEKFFHTYESLVSMIQEKKVDITQDIIDLFFESVDVISNAIGAYRDNKDLTSFFDKFAQKINKLKTKDSGSGEEANKKGRMKELFRQFGLEEFKPESLVFNETNKKFYNITVWLEPECKLKTARLFVIIKNLGTHGVIAKSVPQFVDLMDGLFKDSFSLLFQSTDTASELEKIIMATDEVASAKCEELSLEKAKSLLQVEAQEKEVEKETAVLESSTQINNVTVELTVLDELLELFGELLIRTKQLDEIREINNQEYIIHADQKELLRLYRLERLFKTEKKDVIRKSLKIIHIKKGDKNYALAVDEFLRESEIVIKKIDDMPSEVKGIAGAAILDDGTVSLIIDPFSVIS